MEERVIGSAEETNLMRAWVERNVGKPQDAGSWQSLSDQIAEALVRLFKGEGN